MLLNLSVLEAAPHCEPRARSRKAKLSWHVPDPLIRSHNSLGHLALGNPSCYLSWPTALVSQCCSCRHRGNKTIH